MDVEAGIKEFHKTEKDLRDMMNSGDAGEAQLAQAFDLGNFLENTSMLFLII